MSRLLAVRQSGPVAARSIQKILLAQGAAFDLSGDIALNTAHRLITDGNPHGTTADQVPVTPSGFIESADTQAALYELAASMGYKRIASGNLAGLSYLELADPGDYLITYRDAMPNSAAPTQPAYDTGANPYPVFSLQHLLTAENADNFITTVSASLPPVYGGGYPSPVTMQLDTAEGSVLIETSALNIVPGINYDIEIDTPSNPALAGAFSGYVGDSFGTLVDEGGGLWAARGVTPESTNAPRLLFSPEGAYAPVISDWRVIPAPNQQFTGPDINSVTTASGIPGYMSIVRIENVGVDAALRIGHIYWGSYTEGGDSDRFGHGTPVRGPAAVRLVCGYNWSPGFSYVNGGYEIWKRY